MSHSLNLRVKTPPKPPENKVSISEKPTSSLPQDAQHIGTWPSQMFLEYERPQKWYVWVVIIGILLSSFSLFTKNYLFFIFIVFALLYILVSSRRSATIIHLELYDRGIMVHEKWHPFEDYQDFSIISFGGEYVELVLQPKGKFQFSFDIYILGDDAEEIRGVLKDYLPEVKREETFLHLLGRALRI